MRISKSIVAGRLLPSVRRAYKARVTALLKRGIEIGRGGDPLQSRAILSDAYELALRNQDAMSGAAALANLSQQARLENDFPASLLYAQKIFKLTGPHSRSAAFKGYLTVAHHYASIGQDADVISLMLAAESSLSDANLSDVCEYFELRGTAEARLGNQLESVRAFDTVLDLSERHDSACDRAMRLSSAAFNAVSLGLMGRAFSLHERALSVAKKRRHAIGVAYLDAFVRLGCADRRRPQPFQSSGRSRRTLAERASVR